MKIRRLLPYLGCSFAVGVFSGFSNFSLPLWLGVYISSYALISLVANTRGFLGSIVSPFAGAWSDRVWLGWLGRRRPFILFGGLTSACLMAITPVVARWDLLAAAGIVPQTARAIPIIAVLLAVTVTFNMMDDIQKAMLADLTVEPVRSRLASFSVVTDMGGQVIILIIGFWLAQMFGNTGVPDVAFVVTATLIAIGVLITVTGIREPEPAVWSADRHASEAGSTERLSPRTIMRQYPGAVVLGLVVFCYWFGVNAVLPLVSLYTQNILGATPGEAQLLPALLLLSTTIMAIPMGLLGTRFGKRRIIALGYVIMASAALMGLVITTKEQGAALFLLAGIGNAASMVLTVPLLADLVPRHHMGAATGLLAAAGGIAAPISSLVAGGLADAFNERAIFLVMFVMVMAALALLTRVQVPVAKPTPAPVAGDTITEEYA